MVKFIDMKCMYCQQELEKYNLPYWQENIWQAFECINCKIPIIFLYDKKTDFLKEISFFAKKNNKIYELRLYLDKQKTIVREISDDEIDYNNEPGNLFEINELLDINVDNFNSKLETILTFG